MYRWCLISATLLVISSATLIAEPPIPTPTPGAAETSADLLRQALMLASLDNFSGAAIALDQADQADPNAPYVPLVREAIDNLVHAQNALKQLQTDAINVRLEIARLRKNARVSDRPNLLDPKDKSNHVRAARIREEADEMDQALTDAVQSANKQVQSARSVVRKIDPGKRLQKPVEIETDALPGID